MTTPLTFWLDFTSPYAYFALDAVKRLAETHKRELIWRPILLWAVLKGQNVPAPLEAPAKRAYLLADMARSAEYYGGRRRAFHSPPTAPRAHSTHLQGETAPRHARLVAMSSQLISTRTPTYQMSQRSPKSPLVTA